MAGDYVQTVVKRYRGKVHFWNATGRLITGEALGLDEEQKLRLAGKVIETIRAVNSRHRCSFRSINRGQSAWRAARRNYRRCSLPKLWCDPTSGIAGIGLEINVGTGTNNTLPRDLFEFSNHLDLVGHTRLTAVTVVAHSQRRRQFHSGMATVLVGTLFAANFRPANSSSDHLESTVRH